jgi:acetyltransferase-like isoleucine patch superfamily enzyme
VRHGPLTRSLVARAVGVRDSIGRAFADERERRLRESLGECGVHVKLPSGGTFISPHTIFIGDECIVGPEAWFSAVNTTIRIGKKVTFGPRVAIIAGDHNTSVIGQFIQDVTEKRPEDDRPVVIDDDVWVSSGVTILKGVHIGRRAVLAAGAVVTRDVTPYGVVGGVPARLVHTRFSPDEIAEHETRLYGRVLTAAKDPGEVPGQTQ